MKYNLHVNQLAAIELGITNINQAIIFDFLISVGVWADEIILDNKVYYWISRQKIAKELLILNLTEDTIYRHLKNLAKLGVILYMKQDKKDLIKLTIKAKRYTSRNDDYVLDTRFDSFVSTVSKNCINKVIFTGRKKSVLVDISIDKKGKLLKRDQVLVKLKKIKFTSTEKVLTLRDFEYHRVELDNIYTRFSKAGNTKIWHWLYTNKAEILSNIKKGK